MGRRFAFWVTFWAIWIGGLFVPVIHVDKLVASLLIPVWAAYFALGGGMSGIDPVGVLIALCVVGIHCFVSAFLAFRLSSVFSREDGPPTQPAR